MKLKILSTLLFISNSWAQASLPPDLLFNNKPIDSLCFANNENDTNLINLNNCGLSKEKYKLIGQDKNLINKGYIGYNWQNPEFSSGGEGSTYYTFFAAKNKYFWIYNINNGGGSGTFTAINLIKKIDNHTLSNKVITSGDRCNGGIQNVTEKNGLLTFSMNLTPYDVIILAKQHNPDLKAYDDLAACASCCVAKAFYTVNTDNNPQLKYVDLNRGMNQEDMPDQGAHQNCFNKLFNSYLRDQQIHLQQTQVNELAKKFKQKCSKDK
ncbi:MAG: hypothetical protein PSV35_09250 [bacterium]|nr:hypothetical protein [bacterium]